MMNDPPDGDSPDLTEQDLERVIPTGTPEDMASHLGACPTCEGASFRLKFKTLRRGVHFYSRVTMTCSAKHETTWLFENTWFRQARP